MNIFFTPATIAVLLACLAGAWQPAAWAQEATERYIPIGQSPGLSERYTYLGEVAGYDAEAQALTVRGPAGDRRIRLTGQTRIWLDRSRLRKTNLVGGRDDLTVGRRVEVSYVDAEDRTTADWIKVAVED